VSTTVRKIAVLYKLPSVSYFAIAAWMNLEYVEVSILEIQILSPNSCIESMQTQWKSQ
jgi:hypothetical protein